jgi:hypothetical protein
MPPLPPPPKSPASWSPAERRQLEDQGLFVFGCARSGTTVLYETLNLSPDVYLLGEAFFYLEGDRDDFVGFHWKKHCEYHAPRAKGLYLPQIDGGRGNGFDVLRALGSRHAYVGEKFATGPWMFEWGVADQAPLFAFHATHFFHSWYVLIVRHPAEVVRSMAVMWPRIPPKLLLATWTLSLQTTVEMSFTFPKTLFLSLDRLDSAAVGRLGRELGIELAVPDGRFGIEFQRSAGCGFPAGFEDRAADLAEMTSVYEQVVGAFDRESFRYAGRMHPRQFAETVVGRLRQLTTRLTAVPDGQVSARPNGPLPLAG